MAYVAGARHDIFVSYAHIDNESALADAPGWISALVTTLRLRLAQTLGRGEALDIWFDQHSLKHGERLTPQLKADVAGSAILLIILSPGYVMSPWCLEELAIFASAHADNPDRRIFVVEKTPLESWEMKPEAIRDHISFQMWQLDARRRARTFCDPFQDRAETGYWHALEDIAIEMADVLKAAVREEQARAARPASPAAPAPASPSPAGGAPDGPAVLLAQTTDDLHRERRDVRRFLEDEGFRIVPVADYPQGADAFAAAMNGDLSQAKLFIQLLSDVPGRMPADVPRGYGWLQHDLAASSGAPVMQWRRPDLRLEEIDDAAVRELLSLPSVQAQTLETFKAAALARLRAPPPRPAAVQPVSGYPIVFLDSDPSDADIAREIIDMAGDRIVVSQPLTEGSPEEIREDFEANIVDCDALLMIYGRARPPWIASRLRNAIKTAALKRSMPLRLLGVVEAPPEIKAPLTTSVPGMRRYDCRHGLARPTVDTIIAELASA